MEHSEEHYYKVSRFLLSASGLCPYQSKRSTHLTRGVYSAIMLSSIFFQIASFFTYDLTAEFIVEGIPSLIMIVGGVINTYTRIGHVDRYRELFERMSRDWALQKTHDESKIMHEHAEISRLFTIGFLIVAYIFIGGYNIWMVVPEILDMIFPMNESRPRRRPFNAEFFIDEERYFYIIRSHIHVVLLYMPITYIACSTLYFTLTQHVCGMCELLGYRAERLFCVVEDERACDLIWKSKIIYENMAVFVRQHYEVIKFIGIIETCHTVPFFMDLTGVVFMISLSLIQVLTISDAERAIRSIGVSMAGLGYVFISCYMGQKITDASTNIIEKIFNSTWYNAVVSQQKALLMIMMRRCHPIILTACKFYILSLQNFGMILQTAISYCMFFRS
ncbi:PREDICTED: odorant receptor 22b-like isoform X2 [Vollenhovia emeryi]|uniref:odorant receptor 22b-like isoform X2 n=1 Tax=Vollenhovia emeryi TaxID=411798 RepID=UPI0005F48373|nr:PREDICTED: odorant receptor 22b-like isoform X2 [Vollenhovia emeryi]